MTISFREAKIEDGLVILENLRGQEKRTIKKLQIDAVALLSRALSNSYPSFTCIIDDEPAAIFGGHSETELGEVRLWMLTTPLIERHPIPLLRFSRNFVRSMYKHYGPIVGMVDTEFEISHNWLQWIGFRRVRAGEFEVMRYSGGN